MRDRRRRTDLLLPRERQSTDDNNPYAPPPEGKPDQPWQPRQPSNDDSSGSSDDPSGSSGSSNDKPRWGSQWSSRQPGRSGGGFGGRPNDQNPQNGGSQRPGGSPPGLRWDPTDPTQRRARYGLLSGMWAFFFAVFDFTEIALLLGALALYWSISSLRGKDRRPADPTAAPKPAPAAVTKSGPAGSPQASGGTGTPALSNRSQRTAALTGLVMGGIALLIVAATFTAQLVYRDFYTCERDALTKEGQISCNEKLPEPLRDVIGVTD
ncbi:hypothetical protein [Streptomyces sp. NPDC020965]|uniref:hypothetical protein n=1 Tax=Streptomyces sp. NPDC020965 TaxID=3365105 RepID=UPI0037A45E87